MEKKIQVTLDIKKKKYETLNGVKQYDNKAVIYVKIIQDNMSFDLTGLTVRANFKTSGGQNFYQDATTGVVITNAVAGQVTISLVSGVVQTSGVVSADISLFDSSNYKITSSTFEFMVEPSVYSEDALQGQNRVDLLQKTINDNNADEALRSSSEGTRVTNELARVGNESTRVSNETTRVGNESTRVSQENIRQSNESTRQSNETNRTTAESARASAETARQTAETTRVAQYNTAKSAYDAAVASQSSVEVTDARVDGNNGVTYPNLKSRLNSYNGEAQLVRETIPSGLTQMADIDYTYMSTNPNKIKLINKDTIGFVNGYKVVIAKDTVITLSAPPLDKPREDLVFLEVWLDSVTGIPQNRIRVVDGVDFNSYIKDGFTKSGNSYFNSDGDIMPQGGNTSPIADNGSNLYFSYKFVDYMIRSNPSYLNGIAQQDVGLYVSGNGDLASKTTLKSLDGYVYAIPLFRVYRRPSCGFMESNELSKVSPLGDIINVGKITAKDKMAHTGDIVNVKIEGRVPLVNLLGDAGNCEDLSKWNNTSGCILDNNIKLFGNNSIKAINGQFLSKDVVADQTHKCFVSGHAYISAYTSGSISFSICDYGTNTSATAANFDTTKLNQWQRKSIIVTGKAGVGFRLYINGYAVTSTSYLDGLMIYDLTAIYGAGNEPSDIAQLERELPYVNGIGQTKPVAIRAKGKNSFNKDSVNIDVVGLTPSYGSCSYDGTKFTYDGTSIPANANYGLYIGNNTPLKLKPNTQYTISLSRDVLVGSMTAWLIRVKGYFSSNTLATTDTLSVTFTTENDGRIYLQCYAGMPNSVVCKFSVYNLQIEEGSVATTYEAYQESSVVLPPAITDLKKIGTVADEINTITGDYTKRISDWINLDGSVNWTYQSLAAGLKNVKTNTLYSDSVIGGSLVLKNNGISLANNVAGNIADISYMTGSKEYITVPNADSGWSDSLLPSDNEIKAYFNGWKMCHDDGISPYLPSMVPYTPATWAEWTKTGNVVADNTGMEFTSNGTNVFTSAPSNFKGSTKYGMLINVLSNNLDTGFFAEANLTGIQMALFTQGVVGNIKYTFTTQGSIIDNTLKIRQSILATSGTKIKIKDIRVFELPAGSQIETDFNTLTADQLATKYPFYGLCTKNWKKVTDGTGQTAVLPTGSYAGYTPYKMIYQLSTPVVTNLKDSLEGRLYLSSGMNTVTQENINQAVVNPVAIPNLVTNGDFSNGSTGWSNSGYTITNGTNKLTLVTTQIGTGNYITQSVNVISGHKYLLKYIGKKISGSCSAMISTDSAGYLISNQLNTPIQTDGSFTLSSILPSTGSGSTLIRVFRTASDASIGDTFESYYTIFLDLTAIFGAGNEPSQAWCDKYLAFGTNFKMEAPAGTTALRALQDKNAFDSVQGNIAIIPANKYKANAVNRLFYKLAEGDYLLPDITLTVAFPTVDTTALGTKYNSTVPADLALYDLNGDGIVDVFDMTIASQGVIKCLLKNNANVGSVAVGNAGLVYKKHVDGARDRIQINCTSSLSGLVIGSTYTGTFTEIITGSLTSLRVGDELTNNTYGNMEKIKVIGINGSSITFIVLALQSTSWSGGRWFNGTPRLDSVLSNIIDARDITPLLHQVSLTGYNYQQMLEENFDKLLRGEL